MKAENLIHGTLQDRKDRMNEVWRWIIAIDAYDLNDPKLLEEVRQTEAAPEELRPIIEAIDQGVRMPNKKAAAKLKIPASDRMKIAGSLSVVIGMIEKFKTTDVYDEEWKIRRGIEVWAEQRRREPIDEIRGLEETARKLIADKAAEIGVSVETIENLLRDLRRKIVNWPNI